MILSGHQPCYLPGIQLFNKIALSDAFMFVGHCQYQAKSWHSHNFIRTCELIVPVHSTLGESINETKIADGVWRRKHVKSIELAYQGFRFFDDYFPRIKEIIECSWHFLGTLSTALIRQILEWLGIRTIIFDSEYYKIAGHKEDMLISMCKAVGADEYLSNEGARAYIDYPAEQKMKEAGITHRWQKFTHPNYGQGSEPNGGRLSVIDLLFRFGPEARAIIEHSGTID